MSTHHGFIKEFPWIRVDAFDGDPALVNPFSPHIGPHFHLLTHAHTDHLVGLNAPDFSGKIYCTAITKQIVLKTMEAGERVKFTEAPGTQAIRKFANLKRKERNSGRAPMDRMAVLQINVPLLVECSRGDAIITALDANHCPGSCMFLIESVPSLSSSSSPPRAVLVTGDIRAEKWWVESLSHNSILSKYIRLGIPDSVEQKVDLKGKGKAKVQDGKEERMDLNVEVDRLPRLDCIYLDTSSVLVDEELVGKREAIEQAIELIKHFPSDTKLFINAWTWGYEEFLKGIALAFNEKIHLDEYKLRMYTSPPMQSVDPLLASIGTLSPQPLRFHACERRWKCDQVWSKGIGSFAFSEEDLLTLRGKGKKFKRIGEGDGSGGKTIYVNPWSMPKKRWEEYRERVTKALVVREETEIEGKRSRGQGESALPDFLIVPLARHSTLPELRDFVSIFRPQTLYPLTINDETRQQIKSSTAYPCENYRALPHLFGDILGPRGKEQLELEATRYTNSKLREFGRKSMPDGGVDDFKMAVNEFGPPELYWSNTEGGKDVANLVQQWATSTIVNPPISPVVARKKKSKIVSSSVKSTSSSTALRRAVALSPTVPRKQSIMQSTYSAYILSGSSSTSPALTIPKKEEIVLLPSPFINSQIISPPNLEESITSPPRRRRTNRAGAPPPSSLVSAPATAAAIFRDPITSTAFHRRGNISSHLGSRTIRNVAFATSPTIYSPPSLSSSFNKAPPLPSSPELVIPTITHLVSSLPSSIRSPTREPSLPPKILSQLSSSLVKNVTIRPTSESKEQRQTWQRAFENSLGGIFALDDGTIKPFPIGHYKYLEPKAGVVQGRVEEESQGSFVDVEVTPNRN